MDFITKFKKDLKEAILNPNSGILLNAEIYRNGCGDDISTPNTVFQLTSGIYRKEFVTIWELFDERELFSDCIKALAIMTNKIRESNPFGIIVTSTLPSKELANHIHSEVEEVGDVILRHFGDYPTLSYQQQEVSLFQDERVLILTDVVASCILVKKLGELVNRLGAKVAAILSIVLTNEELIAEHRKDVENRFPVIDVGTDDESNKVRLNFLLDFPIKNITDIDVEGNENVLVRKIDLGSVLPETAMQPKEIPFQVFDIQETISHFENADAIDYGYFSTGIFVYSVAFRLDRILKSNCDSIWTRLKDFIDDGSLITTTFAREDLRFLDFVIDRAKKEGRSLNSLLIMKRGDTMSIPHLYCSRSLNYDNSSFENKDIVILFSAASTSSKLEDIVSLLVYQKVRSIKVICLVNRMGFHTTQFVTRIKRLLRGIGRPTYDGCNSIRWKDVTDSEEGKLGHTSFMFIPLYNVLDIPTEDLLKTRQTIDSIIDRYISRTGPSILRSFAEAVRLMFMPKDLTSRIFERGKNEGIGEYFELEPYRGQKKVRVNTQEGKIFLITQRLVAERDFDPLINALNTENDLKALLHYIRLLISDLNLLRIQRRFKRVMNTLTCRFRKMRKKRFNFEKNNRNILNANDLKSEIENILDREVMFLIGIGFMANYDDSTNYDESFFNFLLFSDKEPNDWLSYPINLALHFSEERLIGIFSMIIKAVYPNFTIYQSQRKLKNSFIEKTKYFMDKFSTISNKEIYGDKNQRNTLISIVKTNLELILTELGHHDFQEKQHIIRYLHREITKHKKTHHNPIIINLSKANDSFTKLFNLAEEINDYERIHFTPKENLPKISDGILASTTLQDLSRLVNQFYVFTPSTFEEHKRYINDEHHVGLARDARLIRRLLEGSKKRFSLSKNDHRKLGELITNISEDFYSKSSSLRKSLESYIVQFDEATKRNLKVASHRLEKSGYGKVWDKELNNFCLRIKNESGSDWDVLVDPLLLQTILRNIFYNVRHTFGVMQGKKGVEKEKKKYEEKVKINLKFIESETRADTEKHNVAVLEVMAFGRPFEKEHLNDETTFANQQSRVREFGGSLKIKNLKEKQGSMVELRLISRKGYIYREESKGKRGIE